MIRGLVVNADDLGRSVGINQGIFAAHDRGIVTSATLMVGFPAAAHAAAGWATRPRLGVGLHVTLSGGGAPTLPPDRVPSLVDAAGRLPRTPEGLGGARFDDLLEEIEHQFAVFARLTGRRPTHLDSHHHAHREPPVLEALVHLARRERLPVRRSSPAIAARLASEGIATTDRFLDGFFGASATLEHLLALLAEAGEGTAELMCHPGEVDAELRAASTYADPRQREIEALTDPRAAQAARDRGLRLISFREIARRPGPG